MRTLQSSRFSNSMPSPTIHVAFNQSSQLEHPSYFRNPALMDDSNPPSLHLDANSLPTPTRGRRRRREPSPSPPRSPAFSTLHQRPHTHTYASHFLSTLTIVLPYEPPYFCAIMNSLSIVSCAQKKTKKSRTPLTISAAPTRARPPRAGDFRLKHQSVRVGALRRHFLATLAVYIAAPRNANEME